MTATSLTIIDSVPALAKGALTTISVALVALSISILLGIALAQLRQSRNKCLLITSLIYTTVIRGIPEIILMLFIFYGGQSFVSYFIEWLQKIGVIRDSDYELILSAFTIGAVTIGVIYAAYMAETFRGALLAIPKGQIEAANSLGLSSKRVLFKIILPQMIRHALPGIGNNWQVMLKATALVSLISLQDLVNTSKNLGTINQQVLLYYLLAAAIFLFFTAVSSLVFKLLEKKYSVGFIRETKTLK